MSARFEVPADTRRKQEQVSDPAVSAWVSANAGAGKTTVLARRVIRLLLAGNPPARILCLTFTKAAAAQMANKVLETLAKWVRLDDAALDAEIQLVSNLEPTHALRAAARRLFADALETPGGLKVQTIHAFCDRVLHQFPFEAGVQAGFDVLDEAQEADLLRRARERVLVRAANEPEGALGRALAVAVAAATDRSLDEALAEAVHERRKMRALGDAGEARVARALGLDPADTEQSVRRNILDNGLLPRGEWKGIAAALRSFGGNAAKCGERLLLAADAMDDAAALEAYLSLFLTGEGEPRADGGFGAAAARNAAPELFDRILRERDRVAALHDRLLAARAYERTAALLVLAGAVIEAFESEKRARGALDYADLIEKTADMLADTGAAWVLYKLDGGIDHVLIDEAQDTSPEQWSVIERLTEEFFAGHGAREHRGRTVFAVGDDKQSIFSFQGADPEKFEDMKRLFQQRVEGAGAPFHPVKLDLSFRSAPGVLRAVDAVFGRPAAFRGLTGGDEERTVHAAIRRSAPALVEVWPPEQPAEREDEGLAWDAPLDARSEASPVVRLVQRIADAVKFWTGGGLAIEDRASGTLRAPRPGDVIVLVRRRGPLFEAVLQALKRKRIPVAGADRLTLSEHIAVMDLLALGDALALEADDLALACALKSPLFGFDEDDLFALAHGRKGTLAAALSAQADDKPKFAEAAEKLARWRREAAELRPFDFYSRVLGRDRGRERMLARIGAEAADALDEFLARALAYEQAETPSLVGFLRFLRRAGTEVKRDLEVASDAVRVMTVHGAKGLEAPLVVLADTTAMPDGRHDERLLALPDGGAFVWALGGKSDSARMSAARAAARERREAEYRRLLYVALTRAADALVLCGHQGRNEPPEGCWYRLVHDALKDGLVEGDGPGFEGKVWRWQPAPAGAGAPAAAAETRPVDLPAWIRRKAPAAAAAAKPIAPSRLDPDDEPLPPFARTAEGALDPRRRGDLLHRLLHRLPDIPAAARRDAALRFLAAAAADVAPQEHEALAAEAIAVVGHPDLAALFGPGSRAETGVLARAAGALEGDVLGRIDRIAVREGEVLLADFKTGRPPAAGREAPTGYLLQLALYRALLARIYPGRAMRALLVWTDGPAIEEIAPERLEATLALSRGKFTAP